MRKRIYILVVFIVLLISACAQNDHLITSTKEKTSEPTQIAQKTLNVTPITPTKEPGCTVRSQKPTPDPTRDALLPPPTDKDWVKGPDDAYVTIVEYSDFQCPACAAFAPVMTQLEENFSDDLRIVYRHFPLSSHDKAQLATQASEAAGLQGKFWEMYDLLFEERDQWVELSEENYIDWLLDRAEDLTLDVDQFKKDINSDAIQSLAEESWERNAAIGMPGTPFLIIDDYPYNGPPDYANIAATVDMILMERIQFSDCPSMSIDPNKQYFATLETVKGDIVLELFPDIAPLAVNNFVFLSRQGWYDDVTFHRVIPGFVAQAGDPSGTGFGGPGYAFDNEISPDKKFNAPGILAMANAGPGSNGSQFFITFTAIPKLDGGYSIFGRVISGMDVVKNLSPRDPSKSMDLPPGDRIIRVTIEEK